jgi:MFS family permease
MESDGRRVVFLFMNPILFIGSLGVAQAHGVTELMVFRVLQAFGGCGGFSVGAGVIADIYRLEERGRAFGIFFAVRRAVIRFPEFLLTPRFRHASSRQPSHL